MLPQNNHKIMQNFKIKNIPNLDTCVLGALELLSTKKVPNINLRKPGKILVVGSGNAAVTGKILFEKNPVVFADESNYNEELKSMKFDFAVIISASGGKHAPLIAKYLKSKRIKSVLITNNQNAPAKKYVEKTYIFPKQREPYTYNVSSYLAIILGKTRENLRDIYKHLKKIDKLIPKNLSKYDSFYFIIPDKFDIVKEMFVTKFEELFGPKISCMAYTEDQTKHAKTVVSSSKELFVSFGKQHKEYGNKKNRLTIPLPKDAGYGAIISVGYYLIGKIQRQNNPWFKENIADYCKKVSKIFGEKISPIVE